MKIKLSLFLVLLPILNGFSQIGLTLSQNPPSVKWRQINSEHYQLIYPVDYEKQAPKVLSSLEAVYAPNAKNLGVTPKKIPVLIQTQNTESNGFVEQTLFRSEFFLTPPQGGFAGTTDWMQTLAVHEDRHIVQMNKERQGKATKYFHGILGDGAGLLFILAPIWFVEGDAVGAETALTQSGRGRIPDFDIELRNRLLTKGPFKYATSLNGSFKQYVPNVYVKGYFMTSYMKNNYGVDVFDKILDRTYGFKRTFRGATRKVTGNKLPKIYKLAMAEATERWTNQLKNIEETPAELLPTKKIDFFAGYFYPHILQDGRTLTLKRGFGDVSQFVIVNNGQEEVIHTPGPFNDANTLSVQQDKITWAEFRYDARFENRQYSVIKTMDINTREIKQITNKTKYHAPSFSPDTKQIAVSEISTDGTNNIVILNAQDGQVIKKIENPNNHLFLQPKWTSDGAAIVAVEQFDNKKQLVSVNVSNGKTEVLFDAGTDNINNPAISGDYVLYNSPMSGIDNIYAVNLKTKENFQVTSRKFGAYYVSGNDKNLVFNDFQIDGYHIAKIKFEPNTWKKANPAELSKNKVFFFEKFAAKEMTNTVFDALPDANYKSKPFRSFQNGFKPYAWGLGVQANGMNIVTPQLGIGLADLLLTTKIKGSIGYDLNEKNVVFGAGIDYERYLPKLSLNYYDTYRSGKGFDAAKKEISDRFNIKTVEAGVAIPLNLTKSKYNQEFKIGAYFAQNKISNFDLLNREITELPNGVFQNMRYALRYSTLHKKSNLDLDTRKGLSINVDYRNTPFQNALTSSQFATNVQLFLPGFSKHHAILLRQAFQSESIDAFKFANSIVLPRGIDNLKVEQLNILTAEYKLPIAYPDLNIGTFANMQRVKTAFWTDYGMAKTKSIKTNYHTVGIDLAFDFGFFGLPIPVSLGARSIYDINTKKVSFVPLLLNFGF
jgi:hypothetical protein